MLFAYHKDVGKLSYERWDLFQRHQKGETSKSHVLLIINLIFEEHIYEARLEFIVILKQDCNFLVRNPALPHLHHNLRNCYSLKCDWF